MSLRFDNRFTRELPGETQIDDRPRQVLAACWSPVALTPVKAPRLLAYSKEMMETLGLSSSVMESELMLAALAGNELLEGMESYAMCYGGHQFGHWAGQLGDGRATNLGEVLCPDGGRFTVQLKGAGPTPYSRRADGRAVLRSSLREYVCSEAMHYLGVPTTRALSLLLTGEEVVRDMFYDGRPAPEPGAIVCRLSPSFIRFGSFEIFAARGDIETLTRLFDFTLARDFPHIDEEGDDRVVTLFLEVCRRTAEMVSHWIRVGFVHGVMNTDNMSILGLTIDYGPYGWLEDFDPNWTPNTTDLPGRRYRFGSQPAVCRWNLLRLAEVLGLLMDDPQRLLEGLDLFANHYQTRADEQTLEKFGLHHRHGADSPDEDSLLMARAFQLMGECEVDMTLFFRALATLGDESDVDHFEDSFYDPQKVQAHRQEWDTWLDEYRARLYRQGGEAEQRREAMNAVNPLYVPRNYLLQEAIDLCQEGDNSRLLDLMECFKTPYTFQPGREHFAKRRPEWARNKPGCSTLSCSS